jgi:magnesium chelatase family protein
MFYITSSALLGVHAIPVHVEAHVAFNMPSFCIVGLPDATVKEARDRIRAAIKQTGLIFPRGRVTVNLAPADVKKQGPIYDLPVALAILLATGQIQPSSIQNCLVVGELGLQGDVRPVKGVLNTAVMAKQMGINEIFVPQENIQEALAVSGLTVYGIPSLRCVVDHLLQASPCTPATRVNTPYKQKDTLDFRHIKGQQLAKRGLEIAAAGGHNVLLSGPPGTGKTLLARAMPSILPNLSYEESIEVTSIASVVGDPQTKQGLISTRPFRTPHHSASAVSLVGGGAWPKPGEVSHAHRGILFLDELPEFSRHALEHLRQPLEDGFVTISRANSSVQFPARFLLIASMNPCPCGYLTDPNQTCDCSPGQIRRYQKRLSGPLLDRFDLTINVPRIESDKLLSDEESESSKQIRTRVEKARQVQNQRYKNHPFFLNSEITQSQIDKYLVLTTEAKQLIELALNKHHLTPRGYARVRKVARTIADLESSKTLSAQHIAEALQFRQDLFLSPQG